MSKTNKQVIKITGRIGKRRGFIAVYPFVGHRGKTASLKNAVVFFIILLFAASNSAAVFFFGDDQLTPA
jgi:membrane-bound metal-dependent hydrolase YbcI (DUF457 family)